MGAKLVIQPEVELQSLNTLAVPSLAQWFAQITSHDLLEEALAFRRNQVDSLIVLGGGSNVVLPPRISGLVLQMATRGKTLEADMANDVLLSVAAGENWHDLVMWCVAQGYYGLENLALIPGSVGAAPIQNIGAYGVELADCFEYLEAIHIETGETLVLTKAGCHFAYRDSIFKQHLKDKVIITRVVFRLQKHPHFCLNYPALREYLGPNQNELSADVLVQAIIAIRQSKLPDPQHMPNAGSFFKNPVINHQTYHELRREFPDLVAFEIDHQHYKLAAGWLLEKAGWKGKSVNGIAMHHQQALVLTNPLRLESSELLNFVEQVKASIRTLFHVELEIEPRIFT